jgi:hypothetical protein
MYETTRIETFISGLRYYKSHFLITDPSSMEDIRIVIQSRGISKNDPQIFQNSGFDP